MPAESILCVDFVRCFLIVKIITLVLTVILTFIFVVVVVVVFFCLFIFFFSSFYSSLGHPPQPLPALCYVFLYVTLHSAYFVCLWIGSCLS